MNNDLKINLIGEDISNLFLAFLLLKKGFKVKVFQKYNSSNNKPTKKIYFISHSTKLILDNLNLWSQIKDEAYLIKSLSISDISILKKVDISSRDFFLKSSKPNNVGWTLCHSDLYDLLFNELSKFKGVFSESNVNVNSVIKDSYKNKISTFKKNFNNRLIIPLLSKNSNSSIEFTASLRGYIDNKYYTIISENGFIFLSPINKNLFRVKWIFKKTFLERTKIFDKNFLMDNLSTILPNGLMIDQIYGNLNINLNYPDIFKSQSKSDNYLIIKKGSFQLLDLRLDGINLTFREVIFIYNQIKNININNKSNISFLKLKFLILKYFKLKIYAVFYELFTIDNHFLNFSKKIILYLYKKVRILKKFILKVTILNFN